MPCEQFNSSISIVFLVMSGGKPPGLSDLLPLQGGCVARASTRGGHMWRELGEHACAKVAVQRLRNRSSS